MVSGVSLPNLWPVLPSSRANTFAGSASLVLISFTISAVVV